jgi:hypothetical protein
VVVRELERAAPLVLAAVIGSFTVQLREHLFQRRTLTIFDEGAYHQRSPHKSKRLVVRFPVARLRRSVTALQLEKLPSEVGSPCTTPFAELCH